MAAAAEAAKPSVAANVDSYIGSLIGLITKSEIRYEGFLFHLNAQETTIGLRNVKSFGTEGRRKDGPQFPPGDKVYDYIFFRGSDIKDLQVISSPPMPTTSSLPDDPAIIQSHFSHSTSTPASLLSSGAAEGAACGSHLQSGFPVPSLQGNLSLHQSLENPGSLDSPLPALPVNSNRPAIANYWLGFPGSSGGISQFQQHGSIQGISQVQQNHFPSPPQGLVVSQPVQQQLDPSNLNSPLLSPVCNGSLNFFPSVPPPTTQSNVGLYTQVVSHPVPCQSNPSTTTAPFLPPVCTGSLNLLPAVPSSSATNPNLGLFPTPSFKLSLGSMPNNNSSYPTTLTADASLQVMSSSETSPFVTSSVPPVREAARSDLGSSFSYPGILASAKSTTDTPSMSLDETRGRSSLTSGLLSRPPMERPSLEILNDDAELLQVSKSQSLPQQSRNAEKSVQQIAKSPAKMKHGDSSSWHYYNRRNSRGMRNEMHKDVLSCPQSSRSHTRGRVNGSYGVTLNSHYGYGSHANGKRHGLNRPLPLHQDNRSLGRENGIQPNGISLHTRVGRNHASKGSKVSQKVAKFTEDFDFEAMNEKFNKEEIWGLFGRSSKAGSESKDEEGEETYENGAQEDGEGLLKSDHRPVYSKDDFFDTLSCNTLNHESGKEKMKFSERRRIDSETFGEIQKHQRGRGIHGPRRAGGFQGSYRGRGYDNTGRERGRTVWSRVT